MSFLKNLFGPEPDYAQLVKDGAIILDVRTDAEYRGGHIKGSQHIPLDQLQAKMASLPKDKTIITCCASGMRSGSAKSQLERKGYTAINGGGWSSLNRKL